MSHKLWISNQLLFNSLSLSTQLSPSRQLILPEGAQPRMWHTGTALSLGPGWTQVTMFGGCPKLESGKSDNAHQKLAKTTVLDFGEQNTYNSIHSFAVSSLFISCTTSDLPNQDKQNSYSLWRRGTHIKPSLITILLLCTGKRTLDKNYTFSINAFTQWFMLELHQRLSECSVVPVQWSTSLQLCT